MTIAIDQNKRLRVWEEPANTFPIGADHTGTLGDFLDCPFITGSLEYQLMEEPIDPEHALQRIDDGNIHEFLSRRATMKFDMNLTTSDARAGDNVTVSQSAFSRVMKIMMGGEHLGIGQTISAASATAPTLDAATGSRRGGALAFARLDTGRLECREIKDISGAVMTLMHALTGASTGVAYGCGTNFMHGTMGDQTLHLQAIIEGLHPQDRYGLFGGRPRGLTFAPMGPGSFGRVSTEWEFADWAIANATDLRGSNGVAMAYNATTTTTLGRATYSNVAPIVIRDSEFRKQVVGTTTIGPVVNVNQVRFTPGISYVDHRGVSGVNTIYQGLRAPVPATVEFDLALEDQTWKNHKDARDLLMCSFQIGSTAARGGVLLSWPTLVVIDVVRATNPISYLTVKCQLLEDRASDEADAIGAVDTFDQALSRFRLHRF